MEKLRSIVLVVRLFLMTFPLIIVTILFPLSPDVASAQLSTTWLDTEHNVKILFTTRPTQPVIGTPTDLEFSVQNLQTGQPITNLLAGVVIVTDTSTSRFTNIAAPDGHFSIKYTFPVIGVYQVITKITSGSHTVASLASFILNIQVQPLALNLIGRNYIFWISAIIATAAGITPFFIVKYAMYRD
jgi:hypothetical protein